GLGFFHSNHASTTINRSLFWPGIFSI
ncbi:hypothetical protein MJO29_001010, partial [Puccinia striiformis f. sp. tritici]